jgi:uncharacterized iron-regulated membrane protein
MRRWHRWLSVLFGVFLLWIAVTGVMSQFAQIVADGERSPVAKQAVAMGEAIVTPARAHEEQLAPAPKAFVCPADMICRPKPDPNGARAWVGYLHHLHSGEEFGPLGTAISILSGLALVFFAFSGLWMYTRMWSHRRSNAHKPGWFWK